MKLTPAAREVLLRNHAKWAAQTIHAVYQHPAESWERCGRSICHQTRQMLKALDRE